MKKLITILACLVLSVSVNAADLLNFPNGAAEDELVTTGKIFYVCSVGGSADHTGTSPDYPLATIDAAINKCTANKGDVIYVMPNHAETIGSAGAITCDIEGISVIGLGNGDNRGVVTIATATSADVSITADNVTIKNLLFKCGLDAVTDMIDIDTAAYTTIDNCYFQMSSASYQAVSGIDINGGCSFATIKNCEFYATTAGAEEAIHIGSDTLIPDRIKVINNIIDGDFDNACIYSAVAATYITIKGNELTNVQTGDHVIELQAAATGNIAYNYGYTDMTQATGIDPGSCKCIENYTTDAIDLSGILTPAGT